MMAAMKLADLQSWAQNMDDAKRTVACSRSDAARVQAAIAEMGLSGIITVIASPFVQDGQALVMNGHAWRP